MAKAVKLLERDLQNGPYHCFGHHGRCSPDFFLSAKERLESARDTSGDGAAGDGDTDHPDKSDDDLECELSYNENERTSTNEQNVSNNHMYIRLFG